MKFSNFINIFLIIIDLYMTKKEFDYKTDHVYDYVNFSFIKHTL